MYTVYVYIQWTCTRTTATHIGCITPPYSSDGGWIDRGRWRRGYRLAFLGVMTLTQCSAMASVCSTYYFFRETAGMIAVEKGASTVYDRCLVCDDVEEGVKTLLRDPTTTAHGGGTFNPSILLLMLMNSCAGPLGTFNLERWEGWLDHRTQPSQWPRMGHASFTFSWETRIDILKWTERPEVM